MVDKNTTLQYRFGMPGQTLSATEINKIKSVINEELKFPSLLILSGSLSEGMPQDLYAQIIQQLADKNVKIVIDTSGEALLQTLKEPVFLMKPNQKELAQLAGQTHLNAEAQEAFAMTLIKENKAQYVAVSKGADGAFLASEKGIFHCKPPKINVKSTIGAGDSMVAGMVYAIQNGLSDQEIITWGVVCGAATTITEGTNLATKDHIKYVFDLLHDD